MLIQLLGDVLSPARCAACDLAVPRDRVFCTACAATVERCSDFDRRVHGDPVVLRRDVVEVAAIPGGRAINAELTLADVAFGHYGGALATAIRRMKYEDRPHLARPLGELLRGACRLAGIAADAVVPVPLHPRRLIERGYNQAALLAAHVARELAAPLLTTVLVRRIDTAPQAKLSGAERHMNLASAIELTSKRSVQGRVIALVDDVSTTGATLGACRSALLAAGARRIVGVVLARTPPSALGIPLGLDTGAVLDIGEGRDCASSGCANVPLRANLRN